MGYSISVEMSANSDANASSQVLVVNPEEGLFFLLNIILMD